MEQQTNQQQTQQAAQTKGGSRGWMAAAIIFAIGFLGTGGYIAYDALNKDGGQKNDTASGSNAQTKCDVAEGTDKNETGDIAQNQSGDYVFSFMKSGIKLNIGSDYEFVNYAYSSSPSYDDAWSERVSIGGLSKNTYGYQNIPDFSRGRYQFAGGTEEELRTEWVALMHLDVYSKSYWDEHIQPSIEETMTNGGPNMWGDLVYSDDNYVILYSHPQNIFSSTDWEQQWEMDTTKALENAAKNSDNWSK